MRPINDPGAPDEEQWINYVEPYLGENWLEVPWLFIETYFYRRVVAASGYFREPDQPWADPFRPEKLRGLQEVNDAARAALASQGIAHGLLLSLWGNQADLSLWPSGEAGDGGDKPTPAADRLLVDEREAISDHLAAMGKGPVRMDLILDNAGRELAADLVLADRLLSAHPNLTLHLHAKVHPTYVSDATTADVEAAMSRMVHAGEHSVQRLGERLESSLAANRLELRRPAFWVSPLPGWELPPNLERELAASDLLLFKGDYNYRRLLGDRRWDLTRPFAEVVRYLPAPAVTLRSLKSDVAVGLPAEAIEFARRRDPDWMIDGRWGMIQFAR